MPLASALINGVKDGVAASNLGIVAPVGAGVFSSIDKLVQHMNALKAEMSTLVASSASAKDLLADLNAHPTPERAQALDNGLKTLLAVLDSFDVRHKKVIKNPLARMKIKLLPPPYLKDWTEARTNVVDMMARINTLNTRESAEGIRELSRQVTTLMDKMPGADDEGDAFLCWADFEPVRTFTKAGGKGAVKIVGFVEKYRKREVVVRRYSQAQVDDFKRDLAFLKAHRGQDNLENLIAASRTNVGVLVIATDSGIYTPDAFWRSCSDSERIRSMLTVARAILEISTRIPLRARDLLRDLETSQIIDSRGNIRLSVEDFETVSHPERQIADYTYTTERKLISREGDFLLNGRDGLVAKTKLMEYARSILEAFIVIFLLRDLLDVDDLEYLLRLDRYYDDRENVYDIDDLDRRYDRDLRYLRLDLRIDRYDFDCKLLSDLLAFATQARDSQACFGHIEDADDEDSGMGTVPGYSLESADGIWDEVGNAWKKRG